EEDADEPPLLLRCRLVDAKRSPARETEPRDLGVLLAASCANEHRQRLRPSPAGASRRGRRPLRTGPHAWHRDTSGAARRPPPRTALNRAEIANDPPIRTGPHAWHRSTPEGTVAPARADRSRCQARGRLEGTRRQPICLPISATMPSTSCAKAPNSALGICCGPSDSASSGRG